MKNKFEPAVVTPNLRDSITKAEKQDFDPKKYHKLLFDKQFFAATKTRRNFCKGVYYDTANSLCVALTDCQMVIRSYDSSNPKFLMFNNKLVNPDCNSEKYNKEIGGYYMRKSNYPDYLNEDIIYKNYACQFTLPHTALKELSLRVKKAIKKSSEAENAICFTVNGKWFDFSAEYLLAGLEILKSSSNTESDVKVFFPTEANNPNITILCGNMMYVLMGLVFDEDDLEWAIYLGVFESIVEELQQ